jgi:very-short-patch-repair endonuclease
MATGREPDSEFEVFVAERLRREGLEVVPQVGVAGYFIDLAVRDPADPQRYLLGIECDGASYHSAKSARDRDRLRQEILEQKGWRLYRIWSTD